MKSMETKDTRSLMEQLEDQWVIWTLVAVLAAGFLIRLYGATHWPMDSDEEWYIADARLILQGMTPFVDFHTRSPVFLFAIAAFMKAFGVGVVSARLVTVFSSTILAGVLFLIGKQLYNPKAGLVAAALFSLSPFTIRYGFTAVTESFSMMLLGVSLYLLIRGIEKKRWHFFLLHGLFLALAIFSRRSGLIFIITEPILLAIIFYRHREVFNSAKELAMPILAAAAGLGTFALPVFLFFSSSSDTFYENYINPAMAQPQMFRPLIWVFSDVGYQGIHLLIPAVMFMVLWIIPHIQERFVPWLKLAVLGLGIMMLLSLLKVIFGIFDSLYYNPFIEKYLETGFIPSINLILIGTDSLGSFKESGWTSVVGGWMAALVFVTVLVLLPVEKRVFRFRRVGWTRRSSREAQPDEDLAYYTLVVPGAGKLVFLLLIGTGILILAGFAFTATLNDIVVDTLFLFFLVAFSGLALTSALWTMEGRRPVSGSMFLVPGLGITLAAAAAVLYLPATRTDFLADFLKTGYLGYILAVIITVALVLPFLGEEKDQKDDDGKRESKHERKKGPLPPKRKRSRGGTDDDQEINPFAHQSGEDFLRLHALEVCLLLGLIISLAAAALTFRFYTNVYDMEVQRGLYSKLAIIPILLAAAYPLLRWTERELSQLQFMLVSGGLVSVGSAVLAAVTWRNHAADPLVFAALAMALVLFAIYLVKLQPGLPRGRSYSSVFLFFWFASIFGFYLSRRFIMPVYFLELAPAACVMGGALIWWFCENFQGDRRLGTVMFVFLLALSATSTQAMLFNSDYFLLDEDQADLHPPIATVEEIGKHLKDNTRSDDQLLCWPTYAAEADRSVVFNITHGLSYMEGTYETFQYPSLRQIADDMVRDPVPYVVLDNAIINFWLMGSGEGAFLWDVIESRYDVEAEFDHIQVLSYNPDKLSQTNRDVSVDGNLVTFRLSGTYGSHYTNVAVIGDFNNWGLDGTELPMQITHEGYPTLPVPYVNHTLSATIELPFGGTRYAFVGDGRDIFWDPTNPDIEWNDDSGRFESKLDVEVRPVDINRVLQGQTGELFSTEARAATSLGAYTSDIGFFVLQEGGSHLLVGVFGTLPEVTRGDVVRVSGMISRVDNLDLLYLSCNDEDVVVVSDEDDDFIQVNPQPIRNILERSGPDEPYLIPDGTVAMVTGDVTMFHADSITLSEPSGYSMGIRFLQNQTRDLPQWSAGDQVAVNGIVLSNDDRYERVLLITHINGDTVVIDPVMREDIHRARNFLGATLSIRGTVSSPPGELNYPIPRKDDIVTFFIDDGTGGVMVSVPLADGTGTPFSQSLPLGTDVFLKGVMSDDTYGMQYLDVTALEDVKTYGIKSVVRTNLDIAKIGETHEGRLVTVRGQVESIESGNNRFVLSDATGSVTVDLGFGEGMDAMDLSILSELEVTGIISQRLEPLQSSGGYRLMPRSISDIEKQ